MKKIFTRLYIVGGIVLVYSFIIQPVMKKYYQLPPINMFIPLGILAIAIFALRIQGEKEAEKQTDESPK